MQRKVSASLVCFLILLTATACSKAPETSIDIPPHSTVSHTNSSTVEQSSSSQSTENSSQTKSSTSTTEESSSTSSPEETTSSEPPVVTEPNVGLYKADTLECLYLQESKPTLYPASLAKILTACTALHYVSPDTVYTVGSELKLVKPYSSLCLIQQGHKLKLSDLLKGMLLNSGNDAAYTVAVNVARDVAKNPKLSDADAVSCFVKLMNDYAAELGATNSHFANPEGWDDPTQQTTVRDLALISANAMKDDTIREIVRTQSERVVFASGEIATWNNTNALLYPDSPYYIPQTIGLKTGTTLLAGNNLIAVFDVNGTEYIAVITGCETNEERYETAHTLFDMI